MNRQRGAALLLALFVVGIVSSLATQMTGDHLTNIRYQRNYLYGEQAYFYLLSAENLALHMLTEDIQEDRSGSRWHDSGCENWASGRKMSIPGGVLSVRIEDTSSRFNINSLRPSIAMQKSGRVAPYNFHHRVFIRLLQIVSPDIGEEEAVRITRRVVDRIDWDEHKQGDDGLEDEEYQSLGLPYRIANSPLISTSELRFIPGIDRDLFLRLRRYVIAWPRWPNAMNINTIPSALMRAIPDTEGLRPANQIDIDYALAERDNQDLSYNFTEGKPQRTCGYENVGEFAGLVSWSQQVSQAQLGTQSSHFLIKSQVRIGDIVTRMESIIQRGRNARLRVIARSFHEI